MLRRSSLPLNKSAVRGAPSPDPDHSRAALAAALDPIITIDASGIIESASDSVERVFGWTPGELIGQNVSVLMPEPHRSAHDGYLARYARTNRTGVLGTTRRFEAQRKDGSVFAIELSISRADVPTRAGPLFVGIVRDLSGVRSPGADDDDARRMRDLLIEQTSALEQAHLRLRLADRMASIGTLAAGLGHDMNNVLLPVRAQLNVLEAATRRRARPGPASRVKDAPIHTRRAVEAITASVAYLQQLADGLHYLAQNPDNTQPDGVALDVRDWWDHTGVVIAKAVPRHVKLIAKVPAGLPDVTVAPHRLTQAILNLVVNAGEAIPTLADDPRRKRRQGLVRVTARTDTDERGRVWVLLAVSDNGVGMTPEVKRRALELFFTTKSRGHGTGLGLPLVHKVAVRAGGNLEIESAPGQGTTVTMRLPAVAEDSRTRARPRVVIDVKDPRLASLVRHLLDGAGCQVVPASGTRRRGGRVDLCIRGPEGIAETEAAGEARRAGLRPDVRTVILPPRAGFSALRAAIASALSRLASSIES